MINLEGVKKITKKIYYMRNTPLKEILTPPLSAYMERGSDIWTCEGLIILDSFIPDVAVQAIVIHQARNSLAHGSRGWQQPLRQYRNLQ